MLRRYLGAGALLGLVGAIVVAVALTLKREPERYDYRVVVIPKGLTHEFWQSIHRGAERAATDLDREEHVKVEIIWDGPLKENEALAQIRIVDRRISTRVDGIVLAPQHSQTMVAPVERAVEQGIPVVIIDSGLNAPNLFVKYVATNNYNGGRLAAMHLLDVLAKEGNEAPNLVLLRYQVGSESTDQREKGFEDYIEQAIAQQKAAGKPTITWLSRDKYAGATKDTALKEAKPLLNNLRGKRIDGIFAPNESSASGMLEALRSLEITPRPRLMGFDSSEPLLQAVREGDVDGLILQDPYKMGYLGVWTLVHHLQGYDVAGGARLLGATERVMNGLVEPDPFHVGFFGVETLIPSLEGCDRDQDKVLGTGEHVITKANVNALSTGELFNPELQSQRQMLHPVYLRKRDPR
jgi:ribose transport system substrate-binding protein